MKFKIYPDQNLLVDVCTGSLKYEHLTELVLHEINDPNFGSVNRILSNIADASFEITAQELEEFAKMIGSLPQERNPGGPSLRAVRRRWLSLSC